VTYLDVPSLALALQRPVWSLSGSGRRSVVLALAEETDLLQRRDAARLSVYDRAAGPYREACRAAALVELPVVEAHARLCDIAERLLPTDILQRASDADAQ